MRRQVYRGRIVDLGIERVVLPNGVEVELEVVRHPGASAVVPVDEASRVVLLRQFRHAVGGFIWEIPAGLPDRPEETPEACALRELVEETGLRAGTLTHLATILTTPGFSDERVHLFLAGALEEEEPRRAHDEVIAEVRRIPLPEALAMVGRGEIVDARTICGLYLAGERLGCTP